MTLLEDIQDAAVDGGSDLGALLRKCKVLAARLRSKPLEDWLLWESNGYPDGVSVPEYRVWSLQLKGHFAGPFGSGLRNAPIPLALLPERARKLYMSYECRQSVASIEAVLKTNEEGPVQLNTGDLVLAISTNVYEGQNCLQVWAELAKGNLVELLNSVRNRILDFALAVWKEQPTAGEPEGKQAGTALKSSRVTQIFHTTVYGGSTNLVGTASAAHITFNVGAADIASLEHVLRQNDVLEEDIAELRNALQSEEHPVSQEKYGPKVSSWIAKMVKKAAEGTWAVGVATAGQLLPKLIAKFYGFH
ncbi:MAG: hypothetical protein ABSH44_06680 [Bryobacteraceae bacterium]|jgi:hypothetical protein